MRTFTSYLVLAALLGLATTAELKWEPCEGHGNPANQCIVHQANFEPCAGGSGPGICYLPMGHTVSFSFDFTPNFSGSNLQTSIWWKHLYGYLPMDSTWNDVNPCDSTACPVTAGVRQTYNRTFTLFDNSWPQDYRLESRMWTQEDRYCCFVFTINLSRWWNLP